MRNLFTLLLFALCFIFPVDTYSETLPPPQDNGQHVARPSNNNSRPSTARPSNHNDDEDQNQRPAVNRPTQNNHRPPVNNARPSNSRPSNNNARPTRPSNNNRPVNYNRPPQNRPVQPPPPHAGHKPGGPHVVATHSRTYYPRPRTYYTSTYYVEPAVVYTDNSYVVVDDTESVSYESSGKFGFGLNALLAVNSSIGDITNYASGGLGLYIKFRPARYFSLELQNNYLFGALQYTGWDSQSYAKTLFGLGARIHFLDYGSTDVYAALAGTVSVWSYISGYDYWYDNYTYMNEHSIQYGGQLGAGISYIAGSLEIGMDLRYTVESVPDFVPGYFDKDSDGVIHGMLLTLNLGFSL